MWVGLCPNKEKGFDMMKRSLITVASMTYAMKAKNILDANMIASTIVRLPEKYTDSGCTFALSVEPSLANRAAYVLDMSGAPYRKVIFDE